RGHLFYLAVNLPVVLCEHGLFATSQLVFCTDVIPHACHGRFVLPESGMKSASRDGENGFACDAPVSLAGDPDVLTSMLAVSLWLRSARLAKSAD
ncbi:hypothetical protein ABTL28_19160, partial [Acinetobacter baumannii]